jgi:DNA-binding GntR family transcriptional regulator
MTPMSPPLKLERPQLLTELAFERIRNGIVVGEFRLGEQLSEAQLAQRMGISKTPVREALLRLRVEGLVEIHPQRGSFIFSLAPEQVDQLLRFREMLEIAALRESAAEDPARLARDMAVHVQQMAKAERKSDLAALARIDMEFHWQLFTHCRNSYLRSGYELVRHQLSALRYRSPIPRPVQSHQVLVDALTGGDIDRACALLHDHIVENAARYRAVCGSAAEARRPPSGPTAP